MRMHAFGILFAAGIIIAASFAWSKLHSPPADHSAEIAATIGASSCYLTSYGLTNRLDGSKSPLYDCTMGDGSEKCVTRENGVINDETSVAKMVFSQTLAADTPSCAT